MHEGKGAWCRELQYLCCWGVKNQTQRLWLSPSVPVARKVNTAVCEVSSDRRIGGEPGPLLVYVHTVGVAKEHRGSSVKMLKDGLRRHYYRVARAYCRPSCTAVLPRRMWEGCVSGWWDGTDDLFFVEFRTRYAGKCFWGYIDRGAW